MRVEAEKLSCLRGERLIFRDLSFAVGPGGALVLTGPNGSGKTTLLRVIAGLLSATVGRLAIIGPDGIALSGEVRDRSFHYVAHTDGVKPAMTVLEMLRFQTDMMSAARTEIPAALDAWGLTALAQTNGALLSAGQKRRLALARLSLQTRPLWLLDEPLVAIDAEARGHLLATCAAHRAKGGLIIAASHEPFLEDGAKLQLRRAA
jgi:heme exporter protein A